jgi:hypothetical protein
MTNNHAELIAEAQYERDVADSPEAQALQNAIADAVDAYEDFLQRRNLIWDSSDDPDCPRIRVESLIITRSFGERFGETDYRRQHDTRALSLLAFRPTHARAHRLLH